jgi:ATP-dependent DNA ligase
MRRAPHRGAGGDLAKVLRRPIEGIAFNEHYSGDGAIIYKHAYALGCEGIAASRLGSHCKSGRAVIWLKIKNPAASAVRREADGDRN